MMSFKSFSLPLFAFQVAFSFFTMPALAARAADASDGHESVITVDEVIPGDKAGEDLFMGDWEGRWSKGFPPELVAQVVPQGSGKYLINFLPAFDERCPALAVVEAKVDGEQLRFEQAGWSGQIDGDELSGTGLVRNNPTPFTLRKAVRVSPRLGAKPPKDAMVLFDGGDLAEWESDGRGGIQEIQWQKIDDFLRVWPPQEKHVIVAGIRTRQAWPSFQLHVEFRLPLIATGTGQTRGNSGVILEEFEFYEVQILDSYGLPGYWDECGAIYKKEAPKVNMCAPPGQWQSYDITYHAAEFDDAGKLGRRPRITINHNGQLIHNNTELPYSDRAVEQRQKEPTARTPGRITLQNHGDAIDFRNIWVRPITRKKS
ncbi:MAG: 3-keto-disaccharide hydrolase [Planctomycetota bacterium]